MIHIIGTAHSKTQFWSDAIRRGESLDTCTAIVERFESYLSSTAISLNAAVIAEENSEYCVGQMEGGSSVAKKVADELKARHIYCDPDPDPDPEGRRALNIREGREIIWMERVQPLFPNGTSIIFVCGACHSLSFRLLLERNGIDARIHCKDWMILSAHR
jgi:hypothetical protein